MFDDIDWKGNLIAITIILFFVLGVCYLTASENVNIKNKCLSEGGILIERPGELSYCVQGA